MIAGDTVRHRDVNSVGREALRERILASHQRVEGGIVGEHRDHDAARMRDVAGAIRAMRALADERLGFCRGAIINDEMVSGGEQIRRHRHSHRTQSDKSDFLRDF